jgi:hypothetical protein
MKKHGAAIVEKRQKTLTLSGGDDTLLRKEAIKWFRRKGNGFVRVPDTHFGQQGEMRHDHYPEEAR